MTNPKIDCSGVVVKMPLVKNLSYDENRATVLSGLIQALPLDVFVVAPSGKVVLANLTDAALAVLGMDFAQSVNSSFESVLEQLPLDQESRSDIRGHIVRILGGSLLSVSRSYPMLTSRGGELGVQITSIAEPFGMILVVLKTGRKTGERLTRRAQQARILLAQEEERRRIARDLHDGTAQHLALAQVMLETVRKARTFDAIEEACIDIESALSTAQHQMRTLSYVLHPPELSSGGIYEALAAFVRGFARRTGLDVRFQNLAGRLRPSADLEIALYRVAQEALVNVGKHAFAHTVEVRLTTVAKHLVLEVEDDGIGIPSDIIEGRRREAMGVGLSGMRERVEALGGIFCVERRANGTHIGAYFPQRRQTDAAANAVKAQRYCSEPHKARVPPSS